MGTTSSLDHLFCQVLTPKQRCYPVGVKGRNLTWDVNMVTVITML